MTCIEETNRWEGKEENEIGKDAKTGEIRVRVDPKYYRPTEVELLWGDPTKAQKQLGWKRKVSLDVTFSLIHFERRMNSSNAKTGTRH